MSSGGKGATANIISISSIIGIRELATFKTSAFVLIYKVYIKLYAHYDVYT